ncbi:unnamed protein product [Arabidopsis halleri]
MCRSPRDPQTNSQPEPALRPPEPVQARTPELLPSVNSSPSPRGYPNKSSRVPEPILPVHPSRLYKFSEAKSSSSSEAKT